MNVEQLIGRCSRLKQELLIAYGASPPNDGRIERLSDELAAAEREMAAVLDSYQDANGQLKNAA